MPLLYIPARDSRHRIACFALYKALLKQVPGIYLDDPRNSLPSDTVNPLKYMIRKVFRRNTTDISPRLVVSALSNGYKFLHLLHGAKTRNSPEHKTIVNILQRVASGRKPPKIKTPPRPPRTPFLTKHLNPSFIADEWFSQPEEPRYFYTTTERPLPASALGGTGIRRVPFMAMTASGDPFMRTGNPQPAPLGFRHRRLTARRQKWIDYVKDLEGDSLYWAQREDEWDDLVAEAGAEKDCEPEATFAHQIGQTLQYVERVRRIRKLDQLERGKVLYNLVKEETALAQAESIARADDPTGQMGGGLITYHNTNKGPSQSSKTKSTNPRRKNEEVQKKQVARYADFEIRTKLRRRQTHPGTGPRSTNDTIPQQEMQENKQAESSFWADLHGDDIGERSENMNPSRRAQNRIKKRNGNREIADLPWDGKFLEK